MTSVEQQRLLSSLNDIAKAINTQSNILADRLTIIAKHTERPEIKCEPLMAYSEHVSNLGPLPEVVVAFVHDVAKALNPELQEDHEMVFSLDDLGTRARALNSCFDETFGEQHNELSSALQKTVELETRIHQALAQLRTVAGQPSARNQERLSRAITFLEGAVL